jgi:hypothetical protein
MMHGACTAGRIQLGHSTSASGILQHLQLRQLQQGWG